MLTRCVPCTCRSSTLSRASLCRLDAMICQCRQARGLGSTSADRVGSSRCFENGDASNSRPSNGAADRRRAS
eukprot:5659449-Prymnesium_polylepis.1